MSNTGDFATAAQARRTHDLVESCKGLLVGLERSERDARRREPDVATVVIRSLVCRLLALGGGKLADVMPGQMATKLYGQRPGIVALETALRDLGRYLARAAVNPATTTAPGWAAELAGTANYNGLLPALAPASAYAQLTARGLRLDFTGGGAIKVPARLASPLLSGDFIGEGAPIPVRRAGLAATSVGPPKKLAVISHFTDELRQQSIPTIESVIRSCIAQDTGATLDARMLDSAGATAVRPAGLLNGVTPIGATAGGGLTALAGDLGVLAAAIPNAADLVYLMNPADRVRALALSPGLLAVNIIEAPLPALTVVALDAGDFISGEGDQPRFDLSEQALLHMEDTTPLPFASGATVATPSASTWQQDLISIRLIQFVVWQMGRAGRVASVADATW